MKLLTLSIALFFSTIVYGQKLVAEIHDLQLKDRVVFIKAQTDSFLLNKIGSSAYKNASSDFGVTFTIGEFAKNYLFLNKEKLLPNDINNLIQFYTIIDNKVKFGDTLGIYYDDAFGKEIRFATVVDSLKAIAVKKLYSKKMYSKISDISKKENLKQPFVNIVVDKCSQTYFILSKDKQSTHNYSID